MKRVIPLVLFAHAYLAVIYAQDLTSIRNEIDNLAKAGPAEQEDLIADLRDSAIRVKLLNTAGVPGLVNAVSTGERIARQIVAFRRADVQNGASSGSSGSTSAILSPLLPAIFGVSLENGALTRTVSGTTITLRANPAGLFCASGASAAAVALRDDDACRTFWKRVGLTASFDTSRGEKKREIADLQTLDNQFSELTARMELVNHRKLSGEKFSRVFENEIAEWKASAQRFVNLSAAAAASAVETELRNEIDKNLLSLGAKDSYKSAPAAEKARQIEDVIRAALKKMQGELQNAEERRQAWLGALEANAKLQSAVLNAFAWTAEYSFQKPDLAAQAIGSIVAKGERPPSLHSLRMIFAKGYGDKKLDLTGNLSASFFADTRPGMRGGFRDFRGGLESKFRMRDLENYGAPTLGFAGLYVFLNQEPLGLGLVAFNQAQVKERGHIGLFQAKLEFPTANNAIRIPLSFTYANRTELIKETEVRGQVGISFNLDALFIEKSR
ncbi:MAG: hypothetical protein HYZ57_09325 [Acidobacteria bacterium]|nr:hypothetical protein [Acidobacteriota bacterium]MBI3280027.1 hypothetical protein [Acidobacteriota bacterium]